VNHTLKLLYDSTPRLVSRLRYFDLTNDGVGYAYGLSDRGAEEYGGKTLDEHSERTLDHELEISYFHESLENFCDKHGLQLFWQQRRLKQGVNPDAYFSITDPRKDDRNTNHFFLEIERSKIGNYKNGEPSIIRKFKHYYSYYDTPQCEKDWSFKHYRVVAVLPNSDRRENLFRLIPKDLNHRMFWVGTQGNHTADFHTPKGDTFSFSDL